MPDSFVACLGAALAVLTAVLVVLTAVLAAMGTTTRREATRAAMELFCNQKGQNVPHQRSLVSWGRLQLPSEASDAKRPDDRDRDRADRMGARAGRSIQAGGSDGATQSCWAFCQPQPTRAAWHAWAR